MNYVATKQDLSLTPTKDLKKIADHMSLPITCFTLPDLEEQIEILDPYFNTKQIINTCSYFVTQRLNLMDLTMSFTHKVISAIQNSDGYKSFQEFDLDAYLPDDRSKIPDSNIFCQNFKDQTLVSLDLTQANYQVMKLVSPKIFQELSFHDYAAMFSDDHIITSYFSMAKKLRQVIFGNLNPSRQISIMKRVVRKHAFSIKEKYPELNLVSGTHDELIFSGYREDMDLSNEKLNFKKTVFTIKEGGEANKYKYYYKLYPDGKISIKGVPSYLMCEVCCHLSGKQVPSSARTFMHEGRRAIFIDSLY